MVSFIYIISIWLCIKNGQDKNQTKNSSRDNRDDDE